MNKHLSHLFYLLALSSLLVVISGCNKSISDNSSVESPTEGSSLSETLNSDLDSSQTESNLAEQTESNSSSETLNSDLNNNKSENNFSAKDIIIHKISSDNNSVWTEEEHAAAEKLAEELLTFLKNEDMASISQKIAYPITIHVNEQEKTISNADEFIALDFYQVFNENFLRELNQTTELFSNYQGFMLCNNSNIWFEPIEGVMKIKSINN